jgi:hypothetical protein
LSARPYGDPAKVGPAAEALARWADELAAALGRQAPDGAGVARALARLPRRAVDQAPDYDSARQVAWAVNVAYREEQQIGRKAPNPAAEKALTSLAGRLRLALPSGRKTDLSAERGEMLRARQTYDPERFRETLAELAEALGGG